MPKKKRRVYLYLKATDRNKQPKVDGIENIINAFGIQEKQGRFESTEEPGEGVRGSRS